MYATITRALLIPTGWKIHIFQNSQPSAKVWVHKGSVIINSVKVNSVSQLKFQKWRYNGKIIEGHQSHVWNLASTISYSRSTLDSRSTIQAHFHFNVFTFCNKTKISETKVKSLKYASSHFAEIQLSHYSNLIFCKPTLYKSVFSFFYT